MKRSTYRLIFSSIVTSAFIVSPGTFAESSPPSPYKGGFKFENQNNKAQWFQIDGVIKMDQVWFIGKDKRSDFLSGANLRALDVNFSGGMEKDLSYALETSYSDGKAEIGNAFLKYSGLNDHSNFSIGQVPAPFSLENSSSGKWLLFMERSLPVVAFSPDLGLGINAKWWKEDFTVSASVVQPKYNSQLSGSKSSDRWLTAMRATYSPVHTKDTVYHFGISGWHKKMPSNEMSRTDGTRIHNVQLKAKPEIRHRSPEVSLLDTGTIGARSQSVANLEAAGQWGPFHVTGELMKGFIKRDGNNVYPKLQFKGGHIQASYTLTGEARDYDVVNGTFGRIRPTSPQGAWQIATRYSYLNLNHHDIRGGVEKNVTFAVSWYVNNNVRILANYTRANIQPAEKKKTNKRHLNIVGVRAQLVW